MLFNDLPGSYTHRSGNNEVSVSEAEALRLLGEVSRDPKASLNTMRNNPWGRIRLENGTVHFEPLAETPVSSDAGGPTIYVMEGSGGRQLAIELLALLKKHRPVDWLRLNAAFHATPNDIDPPLELEPFVAEIMELLGMAAPSELTFTARPDPAGYNVLGFWPVEKHDAP